MLDIIGKGDTKIFLQFFWGAGRYENIFQNPRFLQKKLVHKKHRHRCDFRLGGEGFLGAHRGPKMVEWGPKLGGL